MATVRTPGTAARASPHGSGGQAAFYVGSGIRREGGSAADRAEENQEARQRPLLSGGCEDDFVYGQKCCSGKRKLTV